MLEKFFSLHQPSRKRDRPSEWTVPGKDQVSVVGATGFEPATFWSQTRHSKYSLALIKIHKPGLFLAFPVILDLLASRSTFPRIPIC